MSTASFFSFKLNADSDYQAKNILFQLFPIQQMSSHYSPNFRDFIMPSNEIVD